MYWVDKEKCYIFVRPEGTEIKYKYYYPTDGAEITDILNDSYYTSATAWNINQSSGIPTSIPATEQQRYTKYPLDYVDKVKSETEAKIAKEEFAKLQEKKKMQELANTLKPLPQQTAENREFAPNGQAQTPEYLWTTHSPSGQTGATGGKNLYQHPETGETSSFEAGQFVQIGVETGLGFVPVAGQIIDIKDLGVAIWELDGWGITFGIIGFIPGMDFLKIQHKIRKAADAAGKVVEKADVYITGKADAATKWLQNQFGTEQFNLAPLGAGRGRGDVYMNGSKLETPNIYKMDGNNPLDDKNINNGGKNDVVGGKEIKSENKNVLDEITAKRNKLIQELDLENLVNELYKNNNDIHFIKRINTTLGITRVELPNGNLKLLISSSDEAVHPNVLEKLTQKFEDKDIYEIVEDKTVKKTAEGTTIHHAEQKAYKWAKSKNYKPLDVSASTLVCPDCARESLINDVKINTPLKKDKK